MLTAEPRTHTALIEITIPCGSDCKDTFITIKKMLSMYLIIEKESIFYSSINANVPSGMIGRYSNAHQWIKGTTKRNMSFIMNICNNLSKRFLGKIKLYKWDQEYLEKNNGYIDVNFPDPL